MSSNKAILEGKSGDCVHNSLRCYQDKIIDTVPKEVLVMQIPGSRTRFGVFGIFQEIGKRECLKGLYRGLSPRLIMYMTQGALLFASYVSFKRVFSLDIPQPKIDTVPYEHKKEDDRAMLSSPS
ncbi:hypothetical protein BC332_03689 [Capsicum chinense]|nr:hypothetical protein BC332_03689 [Capsicum chinense]